MRPPTRRRLLAAGALPIASALAGCGLLTSLRVTDAAPQRTAAYVGEEVDVEARVGNDGYTDGEATVTLTVDGTAVASETVEVEPDDERTVVLEREFDDPGEYDLAVNGVEAGTVTIEPAIAVEDVALRDRTVGVHGAAAVEVTVANRSRAEASTTLTLTENGESVGEREVTVPSASTATVVLDRAYASAGEHTLGVDGEVAGTVRVVDSWREFGLDPTNASRAPDYEGPTGDATTAWQVRVPNGTGSSPIVLGDAVFVGTGNPYGAGEPSGGAAAYRASDGEFRWHADLGGFVFATPAAIDGLLAVGTMDGEFTGEDAGGRVVAVEQATGETAWSKSLGAPAMGSVAATDEAVYVATRDGDLWALDPADGTERWHRELGAPLSGPAVADGAVFVGGWDGVVRALETADGTERWTHDAVGRVRTAPAAADGTVYVASTERGSSYETTGRLDAVDAASGDRTWRTEVDEFMGSTPSVGADGVFAGVGLSVWAFERADGSVRWRGPDADAGTGTSGSPAVVDGTVYGGLGRVNGGAVVAFDPTDGTERWRTAGDASGCSPAVIGGRAYVTTDFGTLRAIEEG